MITSIWISPGGDGTAARTIREQVFCQELGLPESLAWDQADSWAYHLVLLLDGLPAAAGRITYAGAGTAGLDRICVLPD